MVNYHLRSQHILLPPSPPLPASRRRLAYTQAQRVKNRTLAGIKKAFPVRRATTNNRNREIREGNSWSRGLNRAQNECYRLAALQCLLHLPRVLNWFLQHDVVQPDAAAVPRVINPCRINARDADTGDLIQDKQDCMVCAMKELIPRYWGDHRMNGQEPMPLDPDDTMLRQIYNHSATTQQFKPQEVVGKNGKKTLVDPQCDAEEWMTYFLGECREASDKNVVPDWEASYRALFEFEFEDRRFCNTCDTHISRNPDSAIDPPASFKQPSLGFNSCPIDRNNPGTVATAIDTALTDEVDSITKDCPTCKSNRVVRKRFRIDAAPEYMLVKFNLVYNAAPPPSPPSTVPRTPDMRKITKGSELPEIDEILDLTQHQVDPSTKLMYRLVAVLPHLGALDRGHWIATVRKPPRWYNINDGDVNQVDVNFALSNPEAVPEKWSDTDEERKKNNNGFQVVVLMYASVP